MPKKKNYGNYAIINGKRIELDEHATDFSILATPENIDQASIDAELENVSPNQTRAKAKSSSTRDTSMNEIRKHNVAHHVYIEKDSQQEMVINDRIFLRAKTPAALEAIKAEYKLVEAGAMSDTHVLKVTSATGQNPIKTANMIAERDDVEYCSPQLMPQRQRHLNSFAATSVLFSEQWYLAGELTSHPDVDPISDIQAPEAWQLTMGDRDIVIAVMDDGVDLGHPAFNGKPFHPAARDFVTGSASPTPGADDFHGTPVASIAAGVQGSAMIGVAPGCTVLPLRIGFGPLDQLQTLREFEYASRHADVVNCSFGFPPLPFNLFDPGFVAQMTEFTRSGGRRGNGLVMVFSAGNDGAPSSLAAADNINGVRFLGFNELKQPIVRSINAGNEVFSAYPSIPGTVVVSSLSSLGKKSGYSNWGPEITVAAPSSNGHELSNLVPDFTGQYRGLGQIAATNRPEHGRASRPLRDDPTTSNVREDYYTDDFGGTSGAAPVVSGIIGLMLSANPALSANEVRNILMATADRNLDVLPDLPNDPNLQAKTGDFVAGRSLFFGSGKANALRAVSRANALKPPDMGGVRQGFATVNHPIPDNNPQGVVSSIEITGAGLVRNMSVSVNISHTYQGDLGITLVSPEGFTATLHRVHEGGAADELVHTYSNSNNQELANLASGGVEGRGTWRLHVTDRLSRDTGIFNSWGISLLPPT